MKMTRSILSQIVSSAVMVMLGAGISLGSRSYRSVYDPPDLPLRKETVVMVIESTEAQTETEEDQTETGEESNEETTGEEENFVPSLKTLNLAFYYNNENRADTGDTEENGSTEASAGESAAGKIVRELSQKDSAWLSSIYDLTCGTPEEAAARLGQPISAVTGRISSGEGQADDVIREWSSIDLFFFDEAGNHIQADSNIKEIMAMANTYFYYTDPEDPEGFLAYVTELWDKSHQYSFSISDVYYCDGRCAAENIKPEEDYTLPFEETEPPESESSGAYEQEIGPGMDLPENTVAEVEMAAMGQLSQMEAAMESESTAAPETQVETETAVNERPAGPGETVGTEGADVEETQPLAIENTVPEDESPEAFSMCPGHVDLHITAVITGLSSSKNSLFALDTYGGRHNEEIPADSAKAEAFLWTGWTDENKKAAIDLAEQDWKTAYGLTVSSSYISNPLSIEEINAYMQLLPEDMGQIRRELIRYALSSVGKVPYYWGGKPSAAGYEKNHFGTLTEPDEKGRTMSGLDCSGWINWVYWSAIDCRLPGGSTSGLVSCGVAVSKEELKPGDIVLRLGNNAHVVMFLGWEADGKMKVIHESSGIINNVTISTMAAEWPYYRKLID